MARPLIVLRDAALVVLLAGGLAIASNALRGASRLPLVATRPYDVLVPCPDFKGEATAVEAAQVSAGERGLLLVDAREQPAFAAWHAPGATSIPFDYLAPTSPEVVRKVLSSAARRVIVYGDGADPDSGEQLARELGDRGVRNVTFVRGGAPALRRRLEGGR